MTKSIKEVFDSECKHLKIDAQLVKEVSQLERKFVNRTDDHIQFFGGNLLGTPQMRFLSNDRNAWFDEILQVDDMVVRNELHSLPTVHSDRNVSSDEFNLSVVWLVHAIYVSQKLSASQKQQGMIAALKYLHYRFLGSLMAHNFKYEPDREIAVATYAALNYKYALKAKGSWAALIESRCEDIIDPESIHFRTIQRFDNDDQILYMVTDIQGRIREIVKKMVRVFYEVQASGKRVSSRASVVDLDGVMHVRDLIRDTGRYKRYAHDVMKDKNTFIREELVKIVANAMHTMPERHLTTTLEYMVNNYGNRGNPKISQLIDETLLHTFGFMNENREFTRGGISLADMLTKLRSLYMSSRSTDPSLLKMRELALSIVKQVIKSNNTSLLSSVRTGCIMYIVIRAFTMNYYSNGVVADIAA